MEVFVFKHILAPFIWFDELMQKGVDRTAFFLMRRFGWPKSFMRCGLHAFNVIGAAGALIDAIRDRRGFFIFLMALLILIELLRQVLYHADDSIAGENRGLLSPADLRLIELSRIMKPISWAFLIFNTFGLAYLGDHLYHLSWMMIWSGNLLNFYLARTPNRPPPSEETVRDAVPDAA